MKCVRLIINPALKFPGFVIPAQAGIHYSRWAPACAGATIFKGRVNDKFSKTPGLLALPRRGAYYLADMLIVIGL
jgi:hypothetical protein